MGINGKNSPMSGRRDWQGAGFGIFSMLEEMGAINGFWRHALGFLKRRCLTDDSMLAFFCVCFSLFDDGNVCVPFDADELLKRIRMKVFGRFARAADGGPDGGFADTDGHLESLLERAARVGADKVRRALSGEDALSHMGEPRSIPLAEFFTERSGWLFTRKGYEAVKLLRHKIDPGTSGGIFDNVEDIMSLSDDDGNITDVIDYFKRITHNSITLAPEQAKCILAGMKGRNFIITGGPGTGKTTVVAFMLWKIIAGSDEFADWTIRFAAPSGKAARRIRDSVKEELLTFLTEESAQVALGMEADFRDANAPNLQNAPKKDPFVPEFHCSGLVADETTRRRSQRAFEMLFRAHSSTIERLLEIDRRGKFAFNSQNRFDSKTILVVDEASMIDIGRFASILKAISGGMRVFILGDDKQLMPVDAGAVLGEILSFNGGIVMRLTRSQRFSDASQAGRFARLIRSGDDDIPTGQDGAVTRIGKWDEWADCLEGGPDHAERYPVLLFEPDALSRSKLAGQVDAIVTSWADRFHCASALAGSRERGVGANDAQILCATRSGVFGSDRINMVVERHLRGKMRAFGSERKARGRFFPGEKVMIIENIPSLDLSNGDCGVIAQSSENEGRLAFLSDDAGRAIPLESIPSASIEPSYAITIHKSQGSGYSNILVFLTVGENHPLLTRQLLYTAVTRTKGRVFLVATGKVISAAIQNEQRRDTGIGLFGDGSESEI